MSKPAKDTIRIVAVFAWFVASYAIPFALLPEPHNEINEMGAVMIGSLIAPVGLFALLDAR